MIDADQSAPRTVPTSSGHRRFIALFLATILITAFSGCFIFSEADEAPAKGEEFSPPEPESTPEPEPTQTPTPEPEAQTDDGDGSWYNMDIAKPIFGDFDTVPAVKLSPQTIQSLLPRGEYLVRAVSACGHCHGEKPDDPNSPLSGGRALQDRNGEVIAPNITPDPETGIGNWKAAEIMRAVRASIDKEGRPLSIDAHESFRWMSDRDAKAIAVWLLQQLPRKNQVERRRLGGIERNAWLLWPEHSEVRGYIPQYIESDGAQYGLYLAHFAAACSTCHTPGGASDSSNLFSGGKHWPRGPFDSDAEREEAFTEIQSEFTRATEDGVFPLKGGNLKSTDEDSPLRSYSVEAIKNYLRTGKTPDGLTIDSRFCPTQYYRAMKDADLTAIANYLKGL